MKEIIEKIKGYTHNAETMGNTEVISASLAEEIAVEAYRDALTRLARYFRQIGRLECSREICDLYLPYFEMNQNDMSHV
jgi:hypothetical protein